jgi:chromosome segregation ATPase
LERVKTELQTTKAELQTSRSKAEELNSTIGRLEQEVRDEKVKADEIVNEAQANREEIQSYGQKCDDMQNSIDERDDMISRVEDTNQKLQDNLEDLFADMCSLAQMYQHNENQEESQKLKKNEAIEAVKQKLAAERRSNEGMASKIADIEEENEKLYRKLGKYKDRLEEERKGRREEQERKKEEEHRRKRNGPVSYLNSLHTSTTLDSMDASRSRSMRSSSQRPPSQQHKSRDRSIHEKENSSDNYRSQRRAKY